MEPKWTFWDKNGGIVPVQADRLETHASLPYKAQINKIDDRKETVINITFGTQKCALYDKPNEWFNRVIIKGFGQASYAVALQP